MNLIEFLKENLDAEGLVEFSAVEKNYISKFESPMDMVNEISLELAKAYKKGVVTYGLADYLMNQIYSYMLQDSFLNASGNSLPSPAYDVYDAFDSGEWHRSNDAKDVDPVRKYTNPAIERVLNEYA